MFAKLKEQGERPKYVNGVLIEFACADCRKREGVTQVFHRYNVLGELIETEVVP